MDQPIDKATANKMNAGKTNAITSLVFAIWSFFQVTIPFAIISIISGTFALKKYGQYLAKWQKIIAWIGVIVSVVVLILTVPQVISAIMQAAA